MKLKVLLFFGQLIHCQYLEPFRDYEPDLDPGVTHKLIGEIMKYHQNNKNFGAKATPESSYQISRFVFCYSR